MIPAKKLGMTLVEMTIVGMVLSAGLFLVSGWMGATRQSSKRDLAATMLLELDKSLARYHRACGTYPTSYGPDSAISATLVLLDHERTRKTLEDLPASCWRGPGRRTLIDPWGTPIRYYGNSSESPAVKANNNRPLFISAGPDRDFGDTLHARIGDNLRSDDPGPAGFRLHDIMRDTLSGKEPDSAETDHRPSGGD